MKLAIIGTAGRADDGKKLALDPQRYLDSMKRAALHVATKVGATTLLSGAAAWADHIAILVWYENLPRFSLQLELPAALVPHKLGRCFDDNGTHDFKNNPGAVSNHYHERFRKAFTKTNPTWSPWHDFQSVPPESIRVTPGFLNRNLIVAAEADHVLAMTFGHENVLKDGGTAHTMSHFLARKTGTAWHLDLNTLLLYKDATTS